MTITTTYRVTTDVPEVVNEYIDLDKAPYYPEVCAAQNGNVGSGTENFAEVYEWADFTNLADARVCEHKMALLMKRYTETAEAYRVQHEAEVAAEEADLN